ncbi:hypothetical protein ACFX13_017800 [Malus domestica]
MQPWLSRSPSSVTLFSSDARGLIDACCRVSWLLWVYLNSFSSWSSSPSPTKALKKYFPGKGTRSTDSED